MLFRQGKGSFLKMVFVLVVIAINVCSGKEKSTKNKGSKEEKETTTEQSPQGICMTCFADALGCIRLQKDKEKNEKKDVVACVEESSLKDKDCEEACPRAMKMTGKCKVN